MKYLTTNTINHSLKESSFPDELKESEVIPAYVTLDSLQENYRPVSLLPHISSLWDRETRETKRSENERRERREREEREERREKEERGRGREGGRE